MTNTNSEMGKITLKIVAWNCHQGKIVFHDKLKKIVNKTNADVYIISECPNPETKEIKMLLDSLDLIVGGWNVENDAGVGIFIKSKHHAYIRKGLGKKGNGGHYASCNLYEKLNILGIWIRDNNEKYAQLFLTDLNEYGDTIDSSYVVAGDFNIDPKFNPEITQEIYAFFKKRKLFSAYHHWYNEKYGCETQKTLYKSTKQNPYQGNQPKTHVDYIFTSKEIIHFELGLKDQWIYKDYVLNEKEEWVEAENGKNGRSDHVPILVELNINKELERKQ